jgi:hypothetical protein
MAYKPDEATLQRLSNTNNPKDFLPFTTTSETTTPWNPFAVCGIPHGGPVCCCRVTKKREPCKSSIKIQDTGTGQQRLTTLAREPFDFVRFANQALTSPKNSSARDGIDNGRSNKLASSGMKQPPATRREYHRAL